MADSVHFAGWCPFLTCLEAGPHSHEVCESCGAVRHGNPFGCDACLSELQARNAEMAADLEALKGREAVS